MTRGRWIITGLSFALMIAVSAYVVWSHWPSTGMPWLAWPVHAAVLATVFAEIVTRAFKMKASAYACGIKLRYGTALRACLAGDFAAAITPARSGAEPARYMVLAESDTTPSDRVLILFLELFLEMWSLVLVCAVLAYLFHGRGASTAGLIGLVGGYSVFVLVVGAIGVLVGRRPASKEAPALLKKLGLSEAQWQKTQHTVSGIRSSALSLRHASPAKMSVAYCASVLHVLLKMSALPVLVYMSDPSFPLNMDTLAPLVLWPLALFYGGVAVPAPGGGGVVEGAFAATLVGAIPAHLFAAALLWWRFYTFYFYLLVGAAAAGHAVLSALSSNRHSTAESD